MDVKDRKQESGEPASRGGILRRLSLWAAPLLFRAVSFALFSTCRVTRHGEEHFRQLVASGRPFIASFWHYGVIYVVYQARDVPYVAMVSASKDGEYVARILEGKGFATVRGSRNRGAVSALKGLMREMATGKTAVLVADGSQGPPRKAQAGTILLASKAGAQVLPVAWSAAHYKTFRSWDRTAIPLPFSRVALCYGKPFSVPADLDSAGLEEYRLKLERELDALYEKAWAEFGLQEH